MTLTLKQIALIVVAAALLAAGLVFIMSRSSTVSASTLSFVVPHVATTSLMSVGPQNAVTILPKDAACTGRVISTVGQPIMLSFSTSTLAPSGMQGHIQAASTTVFYNNGDYGCGAISAYGYSASTSITVTQFSQ